MLASLALLILADPDVILAQRAAASAAYAAEAETLIARAAAVGRDDLAGEIRGTLAPPSDDPLAERPSSVRRREINLPEVERHIERRFAEVRRDHAAALFRLSRRLVREGRPALAFGTLEQAAAVDPDYEPVRRLLGDQRVGDEWMTPHHARMRRTRQVWHDRFGWIGADQVARYEAGERFYRSRWMTADEEAAIRSNSRNAWTVETDHFVVRSNHSLERTASLAGRLEAFHRFFRRTYADLFDSSRLAGALLEAGPIPTREKHAVRDFAAREEYVARLSPKMPGVEISTGLYLTGDRTAYFFHREEVARPQDVLYHEVSHQLLYESDARDRPTGADAHFWPIEGFASYLESFDPDAEPGNMVGDVDHVRMLRARERLLDDGDHEPFAQFQSRGMRNFQRGETLDQIRGRYAQATGLTHFFLHADGGRYRRAFLTHLRQIYDARRHGPESLSDLTGLSPAEIDRRYKAYLREIDAQSRRPVIAAE